MKKFIVLFCAGLVVFVSGMIFSCYFRPNRYKYESGRRLKLDTITGRVWIYSKEKDIYIECGKGENPSQPYVSPHTSYVSPHTSTVHEGNSLYWQLFNQLGKTPKE